MDEEFHQRLINQCSEKLISCHDSMLTLIHQLQDIDPNIALFVIDAQSLILKTYFLLEGKYHPILQGIFSENKEKLQENKNE